MKAYKIRIKSKDEFNQAITKAKQLGYKDDCPWHQSVYSIHLTSYGFIEWNYLKSYFKASLYQEISLDDFLNLKEVDCE